MWPEVEKGTAQHKFFIDYDAKRIRSISVTGFEKKIQNWPSLKKISTLINLLKYLKIFWSDQIFLVWVSSQTNIFWSGKSKLAILFKITGYDFKNSLIFCKYTLKLNCNRLKNIWRSFNFVFIDSDQIFVLVWIFARPKFFGLGQTAICPPLSWSSS